jgi:hypothetical protein
MLRAVLCIVTSHSGDSTSYYAVPKMQSVEAKMDIGAITDDQLNMIINQLIKSVEDEQD